MRYNNVNTVNNNYIVFFDEVTNNVMDLGNGQTLQIDTKFNRQHHATEQGIVYATPEDSDIRVGDTVVCQYLTVEENNLLKKADNGYYQIANRDMVFAVLRKIGSGGSDGDMIKKEIIMLDDFILVKPFETSESDYEEVGGMMIPKEETKGNETEATVTHIGSKVTNVKVGDRVKLHKSAQYPLTIEGERYYRVRSSVGVIFKYKD